MKNLLLLSFLFFSLFNTAYAQQMYVVDGKTYPLNTEVEGTITLLYNSIDNEIRFFSKKGNEVLELTNTRVNKRYNEAYKNVLMQHASVDAARVAKVKLTLGSLRDFYNTINAELDATYRYEKTVNLVTYLGGFAGATNAIYSGNETNAFQPKIGLEFELLDAVKLKRHAAVFRASQTFANNDQKHSATEISFNYRFKFIKTETINVYLNTKVAAYAYVTNEIEVPATNELPAMVVNTSESGLIAPVALGLGVDIKLGKGYLFTTYNDAVALNNDSNKEFPLDISLGYKWRL